MEIAREIANCRRLLSRLRLDSISQYVDINKQAGPLRFGVSK